MSGPASGDSVRVLISDDDPMIRDALRELLEAQPDLAVVAVTKDADEAIEHTERLRPAVAVLDVRMPGGGGVRAAREIRERSPRTRILVFSAYNDFGGEAELSELGVIEYLVKGVPNAEIIAAVRRLGDSFGHTEPS